MNWTPKQESPYQTVELVFSPLFYYFFTEAEILQTVSCHSAPCTAGDGAAQQINKADLAGNTDTSSCRVASLSNDFFMTGETRETF